MRPVITIAAVAVGAPGLSTAAHLGALAVASLFYRGPKVHDAPTVRFCTLVPAHDEALVIAATLDAINRNRRPGDLLIVVADRCSDDTAAIARAHGALVLERAPDAEPGRAAARQAGLDFALGHDWDALVWLDADSLIDDGFYDACEQALAGGADALQARSEAAVGRRLVDQASLAAFALQGVTIPRGRDRLRLLVRLRGTGMVVRRRIAEQAHRFVAPASEDLWYSLDLCLAGVRPRHVEDARLRSQNAGDWAVAKTQRTRYEAGRMSAARAYVGPLLRKHDPASLEAAWFLLSPPFAVAVFSIGLALALSLAASWGVGTALFGAALGVLVAVLFVGLVQSRAPWRTWLALVVAPWYVLWKVVLQVQALAGLRRRASYGPTPRHRP